MKDEYSRIYGVDDDYDLDIDYSDLSGFESLLDLDEILPKIRGKIDIGPCMFCDETYGMEHIGSEFVCTRCGRSVSEDEYYIWHLNNFDDSDLY